MTSWRNKIWRYGGGVLLVSVVLVVIFFWQESGHQLEVTFFDVGQGDSILIRTPEHQNILIDGVPDSSVLNSLGRALPFYDHTIDLMVLTHAHADHLEGLIPVLERYDVRQVLYNGVQTQAADFIAWQDLINEKNIPLVIAHAGEVFRFGEVNLLVLYPLTDISRDTVKDLNDTSVVTRLAYQDTSFLFTGDAPVDVEDKILQAGETVNSDVLKVGHHGSKYSSSLEFLQAVDPDYAVISSGAGNKFGHPHQITLMHLKQLNIGMLRTDQMGDIHMVSDGVSIRSQ